MKARSQIKPNQTESHQKSKPESSRRPKRSQPRAEAEAEAEPKPTLEPAAWSRPALLIGANSFLGGPRGGGASFWEAPEGGAPLWGLPSGGTAEKAEP